MKHLIPPLMAGLIVGCSTTQPPPESRHPAPPANEPPASTERTDAWTAPVGELSLSTALDAALQRHPAIELAGARVRAEHARTLQAGVRPNPEAFLEVENIAGNGSRRGLTGAETTLGIRQQLELWDRREKRTRAAEAGAGVAERELATVERAIVAATARQFVRALAAQERAALARERVELEETFVEELNRRAEAGVALPAAVANAELGLTRARIEADRARREMESARLDLARQWGADTVTFETLNGVLDAPPAPDGIDEVLSRLADHPELLRDDAVVAQRHAELDHALAVARPDVTVSAGWRRFEGPDEGAFLLGLSLPLPLFDRNQGGIAEADSRLAAAGAQRALTRLSLETELRRAWNQLSTTREAATRTRDELLPRAQAVVERSMETLTAARASQLDLLDARKQLFETRVHLLDLLEASQLARIEIDLLIGELDLRPSPSLQPRSHSFEQ